MWGWHLCRKQFILKTDLSDRVIFKETGNHCLSLINICNCLTCKQLHYWTQLTKTLDAILWLLWGYFSIFIYFYFSFLRYCKWMWTICLTKSIVSAAQVKHYFLSSLNNKVSILNLSQFHNHRLGKKKLDNLNIHARTVRFTFKFVFLQIFHILLLTCSVSPVHTAAAALKSCYISVISKFQSHTSVLVASFKV